VTTPIVIGLGSNASIEQTIVRLTPDHRLSRTDAARYLGVAPNTLAKWKMLGHGPKPIKIGSRVFYKLVDLDHVIAEGLK
jgi:hypothetical protein